MARPEPAAAPAAREANSKHLRLASHQAPAAELCKHPEQLAPIRPHAFARGDRLAHFDPFTATLEEAQAQADAYAERLDPAARCGAVMRWCGAQQLQQRRAHHEAHPLDGMAECAVFDLAPPDWLARAFLRSYRRVKRAEVATWSEAFAPAWPPRTDLSIAQLRMRKIPELAAFFGRVDAPPRTREGFALAAKALGITPTQARNWTPTTRRNRRGPRWQAKLPDAAVAHDPFGQIARGLKPR